MTRSRADIPPTPRQSRTLLLATDNKNSVLAEIAGGKPQSIAYSAYGQQSAQPDVGTSLGFNGARREKHIGWYLLGNGYRAYNPTLMRFHSPDSWSPFRGGGLNAYMYCAGDPVNFSDPTGHFKLRLPKWVSRTSDFLFGGSEVTGPRNLSPNAVESLINISDETGVLMAPERTGELTALLTVARDVERSATRTLPTIPIELSEGSRITSVATENLSSAPPVPPRPDSTMQNFDFTRIQHRSAGTSVPPAHTPRPYERSAPGGGRLHEGSNGDVVHKMNFFEMNNNVRKK